jgi:hypothetical protein
VATYQWLFVEVREARRGEGDLPKGHKKMSVFIVLILVLVSYCVQFYLNKAVYITTAQRLIGSHIKAFIYCTTLQKN